MAFIQTLADGQGPADDPGVRLLQADREQRGYAANYVRLFASRPRVYEAWRGLVGAITAEMDERRYELVTIAAARQLRSSYCMLAHGKVLADRHLEPAELRAVAADHRHAGLDEVDVAAMDFAERVVDDATAITQADVDRLRAVGLSDVEVLDIALAAAVRCFFSKTLDALGVAPDAEYGALQPELREALTVGRPIAEE